MKKKEKLKEQLTKKMALLKQALSLSSAIIKDAMKGGGEMTMVTYIAMAILDGVYTLEEIKNPKVRRMVKKELEKLKMSAVVEADK